jgi:hypothetical protein
MMMTTMIFTLPLALNLHVVKANRTFVLIQVSTGVIAKAKEDRIGTRMLAQQSHERPSRRQWIANLLLRGVSPIIVTRLCK